MFSLDDLRKKFGPVALAEIANHLKYHEYPVELKERTYYTRVSFRGRDYYNTTLDFYGDDLSLDKTSFSCTCYEYFSNSGRYGGMCWHGALMLFSLGLQLGAYELPETTTASFARYLYGSKQEEARHLQASLSSPLEVRPEGPLSIMPEFDFGEDGLQVKFVMYAGKSKLYVIKKPFEFLLALDTGRRQNFGKKLDCVLAMEHFDELSQELIHYMQAYCARDEEFWPNRFARKELHRIMAGHNVSYRYYSELREKKLTSKVVLVDKVPTDNFGPLFSFEKNTEDSYLLKYIGDLEFLYAHTALYAENKGLFGELPDKYKLVYNFIRNSYNPYSREMCAVIIADGEYEIFANSFVKPIGQENFENLPEEILSLIKEDLKLSFKISSDAARVYCTINSNLTGEAALNLDSAKQLLPDPTQQAQLSQAVACVQKYFGLLKKGHYVIEQDDVDCLGELIYVGFDELKGFGQLLLDEKLLLKQSTNSNVKIDFSARVQSNILNVELMASGMDRDELAGLLTRYSQKKKFYSLSDGRILNLQGLGLEDSLDNLQMLGIGTKDFQAGNTSFSMPAYKAFLLDRAITQDERNSSCAAYLKSLENIKLDDYTAPKDLNCELRSYQVEGYQWIESLCGNGFGGILADEMGLGKTLQMIAYIYQHKDEGKALVVCPASLVYNWAYEINRFAPCLRVQTISGTAAERRKQRKADAHVYVVSYDSLRRDIHEWQDLDFFIEVADEAQFIKNSSTQAALATKAINAKHRFALTGTPIENRLKELWSIMDFLMPGFLSNETTFRDRFENAISQGDDAALERLRQICSPFILRRRKDEVLTELPAKIEQNVMIALDGEQKKLYQAREQQLRDYLLHNQSTIKREAIKVLAELTRLRQLCLSPSLVYEDYKKPSAKIDAIVELVESLDSDGQKCLVFSQFTSFLDLLKKAFKKESISFYEITGATDKKERLRLTEAFNKDDTPVFLISLKAGGTGLNLTGASAVIHADPWWNVAVQDQASDRAHRIGQKREVSVYKLIAKDSIEERMLSLQEAKSELVKNVVDSADGLSFAQLKADDLLSLLEDGD